MSRYVKITVVALVALLLTGCLQASLSLKISPDPIKFAYGEKSKDITFMFSAVGFGTSRVDSLTMQLLDEDGPVDKEAKILIGRHVAPFIDLREAQPLVLPLSFQELDETEYNEQLKGKTYTLAVTVTGSASIETEVDVIFE